MKNDKKKNKSDEMLWMKVCMKTEKWGEKTLRGIKLRMEMELMKKSKNGWFEYFNAKDSVSIVSWRFLYLLCCEGKVHLHQWVHSKWLGLDK